MSRHEPSPGTVHDPREYLVEPVVSDYLYEFDTLYIQLHTCFYMVYRRVSMLGMGVLQVEADAVGGADACMFGVAQTHGFEEELRRPEEYINWHDLPLTLYSSDVR